MYPNPVIEAQSKSLLKALRLSYGIAASRSQAARARQLAPTVQKTHPGIYIVGNSQISLWRMSCTCQEARSRKAAGKPFKPCAHFLALYLVGEWSPSFSIVQLEKCGKTEPALVGWTCRIVNTRGRWKFVEAYADGWIEFTSLTPEHTQNATTWAKLEDIRQLIVIYEWSESNV